MGAPVAISIDPPDNDRNGARSSAEREYFTVAHNLSLRTYSGHILECGSSELLQVVIVVLRPPGWVVDVEHFGTVHPLRIVCGHVCAARA